MANTYCIWYDDLECLPGCAAAAVAGKRRCGLEGRTGWGEGVGAGGWGAPCPNQGANPALQPWGPWERRPHTTPALSQRSLGKTEGWEASISHIHTDNGRFTQHREGKPYLGKQWAHVNCDKMDQCLEKTSGHVGWDITDSLRWQNQEGKINFLRKLTVSKTKNVINTCFAFNTTKVL